ncbi:unnamed protein product [Psylliodes chrysocephalus]|uniref:Uncharacterized protein n=1 Tax=Psylliodes chrysocephalus TaxID=3402493 RepID=A0A9P0GHG3_9CUCU|nr:unnamed protein product [Psylliodes chrysocephala]
MSMSNRTNRILGLVQSRNNIENNTDGLANKENNCTNSKNSQTKSNISDEISEPFSDDSLHDRTYAPSSTDYESESEADSEVESAEDVDSQEEIEGTVLENQEISNVDQNEWGPIKAGEYSLPKSIDDNSKIEVSTRGQASNDLWKEHRSNMLMASNFGTVYK